MSLAKSIWQVGGFTTENLIGGSAIAGAMRHNAVVLLNVEGNEAIYGGKSVEAIQEQPDVLHLPPQGLDH